MSYQRKDHYYKKAKAEGKASRAAYKLQQLQERFHLICKGDRAVDLGCAPGGWMQELSQMVGPKGKVVGIDLLQLAIAPLPNTTFMKGSIEHPENLALIRDHLGSDADVIVSDMAPNTTGVGFADAYHSFELGVLALEACATLLKEGGNFVVKIFPGEELQTYRDRLRAAFEKVQHVTPPATRKTSSEIYFVCRGYKKTH